MGRPKGSKNKKTILKEQEEAAKLQGKVPETTDNCEEDSDLSDRIASLPQMSEKSE